MGQIFKDPTQFEVAVNDYSMNKQFAYCYKMNDRVRVRAKCTAKGCNWEIHASRHGNDNLFRVKTYYLEHPCFLIT